MHARLVKSSSDPRLGKNMKASANNNSELQELQTNSKVKTAMRLLLMKLLGKKSGKWLPHLTVPEIEELL